MNFANAQKIAHEKYWKTQIKAPSTFQPLHILKNDKFYEIQGNIYNNQLHLKFDTQLYIIQIAFWTSFQPFVNENNERGFILGIKSEDYIFYVSNLQQLNSWKKVFSAVTLLRGFYNDYKPLKKIGEGKSASVFLARNRVTGESVAIKAFSKNLMKDDPKSLKALENQIKILRQLNSPNLLIFQSFYQTDKSYYLITKYVEGITLRNLIQFENIDYQKIMDIFRKIVQALNYLTRKGIVHRDLKPQNIIIENNTGKIVIVDFGLAVQFNQKQQHLYVHCGTPGFIAPQILENQQYQVSINSDIFSLGIILHLMLLKKFPYKNASIDNIVEQNRQANFNLSSGQYQCIPIQNRVLLQKMLAKNPRQRITSQQLLQNFQRKQNRTKQNRISPNFHSNRNQANKISSISPKKQDNPGTSIKNAARINLKII